MEQNNKRPTTSKALETLTLKLNREQAYTLLVIINAIANPILKNTMAEAVKAHKSNEIIEALTSFVTNTQLIKFKLEHLGE